MNKSMKSIMGIIFICVGIVIGIAFTLISINRWNVVSDSERVTATIVEVHFPTGNPTVIVEYEVGGNTITTQLSWFSSGMRVGQSVELLVSRQDPYVFVDGGITGWLMPVIFFSMAGIFCGIGVVLLVFEERARYLRNWLLHNGTPVWAIVQEINTDRNYHGSNRPATFLVATYKHMQFRSAPLDNNVLMNMNLGEYVKVLIHPDNANRYIFDFFNESNLQPLEAPAPPHPKVAPEWGR